MEEEEIEEGMDERKEGMKVKNKRENCTIEMEELEEENEEVVIDLRGQVGREKKGRK